MFILGFVTTIAIVTTLVHLYLWKRLVRDTLRPGRARRAGGFAVLALALLIPGTFVAGRNGVTWLAWPGYLWLALMFYLLVVLLVLELPVLVARLAFRRRTRAAEAPVPALVGASTSDGPQATVAPPEAPPEAPDAPPTPPSLDRRLLLARGAAITAGLVALGTTAYGVRTALGPPVVRRVRIPLAKLDRGADGLRIALVSDIHLGPILGRGHTERIVRTINGLDADLVAIVGDLVDGSVAELGAAAEPLSQLRSRRGSYFVTGNHEYFSGYEQWIDEVRRLGLRPLRNERLEIGSIDLAGVNDVNGRQYGDGPDFGQALDGRDPARPVVLLAHQPVQVHESARHGVDLQLSGHTHGGQMYPFHYMVKATGQPVLSGLTRVDGTALYVTRGAGFWGPPVRVGAPPDITLVELRTT